MHPITELELIARRHHDQELRQAIHPTRPQQRRAFGRRPRTVVPTTT